MSDDSLPSAACGHAIEIASASAKARGDDAPLTCPPCCAGIGRDGELVHDPAIGPQRRRITRR